MDSAGKEGESRSQPGDWGCMKRAVGVGMGLALGALAGIVLGLGVGIGIALMLGVL